MLIPKPSQPLSYKVKSSEFICYLFELTSIDQVSELLQPVKKEHHTANHHCWAWRWVVCSEDELRVDEHQSDDGEPRGTAGYPILHRLHHHEIVNTLAVVVRYFGGTKLGKSGLIEAYSAVTELAINASDMILFQGGYELRIHNPYDQENLVKQWLHHQQLSVLNNEFGVGVERQLFIPKEQKQAVQDSLSGWEHRGIVLNWSELKLIESATN